MIRLLKSFALQNLIELKYMNKDAELLTKFFSRKMICNLSMYEWSQIYQDIVLRFISNSEEKTNRQCIDEVYQYLASHYKDEYYYKNEMLNQLVGSADTAIVELPVVGSIADFIIVNDSATVYEIKTALDNFDRLDTQLSDYSRAFAKVSVVVPSEKLGSLLQKINNPKIGIIIETDGQFSVYREPVADMSHLSHRAMFGILRKSEYSAIIKHWFGKLPEVSDFEYYEICGNLFSQIPMQSAYPLFVDALKKRKLQQDISDIPYGFHGLVYFMKLNKREYARFLSFLNQKFTKRCNS